MRIDCGITAGRWVYEAPRNRKTEKDLQMLRFDPCFEITCRTCRKYHAHLFKHMDLSDDENSPEDEKPMPSR
jgi:hypothetical protein